MPRRRVVAKREVLPDPKFGNSTLAKFMNHVMVSGKKSVAETIVYGALDIVQDRLNKDPIEAFDQAGYDGYLTFEYFHPYPHYPEALIHQTADSLDRMLGLHS